MVDVHTYDERIREHKFDVDEMSSGVVEWIIYGM